MYVKKILKLILIIMVIFHPLVLFAQNQQGSIQGKINQPVIKDKKYLQFDIIAKSNNETKFNTIDLQVQFDVDKLKLIKSKNKNDFCVIFLKEEINNKTGKFTLQCGTFGYNATNNAKIISLLFEVNKKGLAEINFNNSRLLANDGKGTNILLYPATHYILN